MKIFVYFFIMSAMLLQFISCSPIVPHIIDDDSLNITSDASSNSQCASTQCFDYDTSSCVTVIEGTNGKDINGNCQTCKRTIYASMADECTNVGEVYSCEEFRTLTDIATGSTSYFNKVCKKNAEPFISGCYTLDIQIDVSQPCTPATSNAIVPPASPPTTNPGTVVSDGTGQTMQVVVSEPAAGRTPEWWCANHGSNNYGGTWECYDVEYANPNDPSDVYTGSAYCDYNGPSDNPTGAPLNATISCKQTSTGIPTSTTASFGTIDEVGSDWSKTFCNSQNQCVMFKCGEASSPGSGWEGPKTGQCYHKLMSEYCGVASQCGQGQ